MGVGRGQLCVLAGLRRKGGSADVSERIDHDTNRCMLVENTSMSVWSASI